MKYLEIKNQAFRAVRAGLGLIMVLIAITWIVLYFDDRKIFDLIIAIVFILTGAFHMTDGFGFEKSWIRQQDDILTIKWMDWLKLRRVTASQIENISLGPYSIRISIRGDRSLKLKLGYMEMAQKKLIYEFLYAFAREKDVVIFRNPDFRS